MLVTALVCCIRNVWASLSLKALWPDLCFILKGFTWFDVIIGGGLIRDVVVKIDDVGGSDDVVEDSVVVQGFSSTVLTTSISSLISSRVSPLELLERSGVAIGADFASSNDSWRDIGL